MSPGCTQEMVAEGMAAILVFAGVRLPPLSHTM